MFAYVIIEIAEQKQSIVQQISYYEIACHFGDVLVLEHEIYVFACFRFNITFATCTSYIIRRRLFIFAGERAEGGREGGGVNKIE